MELKNTTANQLYSNCNKIIDDFNIVEIARKSFEVLQNQLNPDNIAIKYDNDYAVKLSPFEFEHYCADILNKNGFQAKVTQATGDQGCDIIATIHNKDCAIQCKQYTGQVGNKAVQEAIAGKEFYNADCSVVITTSDFTNSAKALADKSNTILLNVRDIHNLKVFIEERMK